MIQIKVPATSANIGPGFDSLGLALQLYLTLDILEETTEWIVDHDIIGLPHDHTHFIVQAAKSLSEDITPHHISVKSEIPLARGLGSSSAALLAGLSMANILANLNLDDQAILEKATALEGHPDNVAPALFGGGVAASYDGNKIYTAPIDLPEAIEFIVFIPDYELKTVDARNALPDYLSFKEAVSASALSNVLIAAINSDDWDTACQMIELDKFHERARSNLVPELKQIRTIAHQLNIKGTYLSGAGPTIITILNKQNSHELLTVLNSKNMTGIFKNLMLDRKGLTIRKEAN
ncbi:homoserine kinase [Leuconostoc palmae]|uniref:homoserine kinase n=1 Tax=Leuconostoc palmae TaxID=501487 RepID=UPI001C7D276D|nr:homoserine kinase [Leuconostoc palmae]